MKIVYLKPTSSFYNNLRSDTIWGLICWGIKILYSESELEKFINSYSNDKNNILRISSPFIFSDFDNKRIHYFPKPIQKSFNLNSQLESKKITERLSRMAMLKSFKNVSLISQKVFENIITGNISEEEFFNDVTNWKKDSQKYLLREFETLHNTIDRLTNTVMEGALFTTDDVFIKNGGLFFLADGDDEYLNKLESVLRFYEHFGLGGDASIGKGCYKITIDNYSLPKVLEPNAFITLSLYSPEKNELLFYKQNPEYFWYELEIRKGKVGGQFLQPQHFWKESTVMFKEGSVFPIMDKKTYGYNKKVKIENANLGFDPVQYGIAFNIPVKLKFTENET